MFGKMALNICLAMVVLFVCGCGVFSSVETGVEPTEILSLDGEFEFSETLEKGETLALDMREPTKSGYIIVGTAFDPELLRLDHYLKYDDDGVRRLQYIFTMLENGTSDILVKMEPIGGGDIEIYKSIRVNIGEDGKLF